MKKGERRDRGINKAREVRQTKVISQVSSRDDRVLRHVASQRRLPPIVTPKTIPVTALHCSMQPLIVEYCTTCYNRFWQLQKALPHNLELLRGDAQARFLVVDFGGADSDEMLQWIRTNDITVQALKAGRLRYFRRVGVGVEPFEWNVAIAKNVAHRLATGDVVVNLDGDNYLQPEDAQRLRGIFTDMPATVVHQTWNNALFVRLAGQMGWRHLIKAHQVQERFHGSYGRISMLRENWLRLGGYDEEMIFMGFQDTDLLARATLWGCRYRALSPIEEVDVGNDGGADKPETAPSKPLALLAAGGDVQLNARTRPYANNRGVTSWEAAENYNKRLSRRKLVQGLYGRNGKGFKEDLHWYQEISIAEEEDMVRDVVDVRDVSGVRDVVGQEEMSEVDVDEIVKVIELR